MSILNPSQTVATGVGIGAVDLLIFMHACPPAADVRTAKADNQDIDTCRRQATLMAVGVNGFVSLMTRDWNVFLIGGVVTVGLSWMLLHANAVHPETGKMTGPGETQAAATENMYALPDYGYGAADQAS